MKCLAFAPTVVAIGIIVALNHCIAASSDHWLDMLHQQGIRDDQITGVDRNGVPQLCGTVKHRSNIQHAPAITTLPQGVRYWENIPSVIRDNGTDTFRLEVNVNGRVSAVRLSVSINLRSASGLSQITLRDDGQANDRVAGDSIYTSESLRFNTSFPFAIFNYLNDTNSPAGLNHADVGQLSIVETNGATNTFLIGPQIGVLSSAIPLVKSISLRTNLLAAPHLINVRTSGGLIQSVLRSLNYDLFSITKSIYSALPDDFDFFIGIPTDHFEKFPTLTSENFVVGIHSQIKTDYTGTGYPLVDNTAAYGSSGRLKSMNLLDVNQRGVYCNNATHELVHQWCAYIDTGLGIADGTAHYTSHSNIGSLVGGQLWTDKGDGSFIMNCAEGRNGSHRAPPLDRYMMGLISASEVSISRAYSELLPGPFLFCDQPVSNIVTTVPISEIIESAGPRVPGPDASQRFFAICFFVETRDRLFTDVEMTFYETLTAFYVAAVPPQQPDPYLTQNWVPITRFFGEDVHWKTSLDSLIRPSITNATHNTNGTFTITGTAFPGQTYTAQHSTNLTTWNSVAPVQANPTNGVLTFTDSTAPSRNATFLRLSWP